MKPDILKPSSGFVLRISVMLMILSAAPCALCQQYGWKNISGNLPDLPHDTVVLGGDTMISMIRTSHFVSDTEGWIVIHNAVDSSFILHTENGGDSWEIRSTHKTAFNAIRMRDQFNGFAGGQDGGIIYKTEDGGYTWNFHWTLGNTLAEIEFPPFPADTGYACGMNGSLMMITPGGGNIVDVNVNSDLHGISFPVNSRQGWISGWNIVRHYLNGTWYADQVHITGYHNDIEFIDNQNGWTCGDRIMHTQDGYNWVNQVTGDQLDGDLFGISFANAYTGCAVGSLGQVFFTSNGGQTWEKLKLGTEEYLIDVEMTSPDCGYITGQGKQIFKYSGETGIEDSEHAYADMLEVYPNPTHGKFRICNSKQPANQAVLIQNCEVVDLFGRTVLSEAGCAAWTLNQNAPELDISSSPGGIFQVRVKTGNELIVKKVIKL